MYAVYYITDLYGWDKYGEFKSLKKAREIQNQLKNSRSEHYSYIISKQTGKKIKTLRQLKER